MIQVHDKKFKPFISRSEIEKRVSEIGMEINADYEGKLPLFIAVLNGAFMFTSDLMKNIHIPCEISFVKVSSYEDMHSTGNIKQLIGLSENILNRELVILEDIVDSGRTIAKLVPEFRSLGAKSVQVATLLRKPPAKELVEEVKYVGFDIPDHFVLGYGLDYNGQGRNFSDIYQYID